MSRMQEKINERAAHVYAGIDVGKTRLDVFIYPSNARLQVPTSIPSSETNLRF